MIQQDNDRGDKAVSETVGFILLFGVVVIGMSFIYVTGYPILQSNMDSSIFQGAEQSFIVMQSDMKMVSFDQTPVKNMNLKLHSAGMWIDDTPSMEISYNGTSTHYPIGKIEYIKEEQSLAYENGAVMAQYDTGSKIMLSDPRIYSTVIGGDNITTIGLVQVNGNGGSSGSSVITLKMEHNDTVLTRTDVPVDVTMVMNSDYAYVWRDHFEDIGFTTSTVNTTYLEAYKNDTFLIIGYNIVDTIIT
ncbi:DUF7289 family protein [Methanococcoides alaskense]|uniref:FlaG/FlaF family flagellin (Archaellin) n=1 Tax=Methanococcoides alaskense TaxID=325778 RepID=A0AA90Z7C3_9EURY|nr:hypothetical protein [Methanococcoides alaskense]MDA0524944.1 hypothetical protein [Methanococcoides alaskense]MDR6222141.1 FlaG/FlaF family flagellin (archaellin) [Methanococcoides alaskense]